MKYRHATATIPALLICTGLLMQTAAASDTPATTKTYLPETYAALAIGYVQGFEHNRATNVSVTLDGNATRPDISVKYTRRTVKGSENVHGKIEYGFGEINGFPSVTSYRCTPCAAD